MKTLSITLLMLSAVFLCSLTPQLKVTPPATYVLDIGFEDGDRTAGGDLNLNASGLACYDYCMQVVSGYSLFGTKAIESDVRFELPKCGSGYRCELQVNKDSSVKERFYSWRMKAIDYVLENVNNVVMQFKESYMNHPPIAIWQNGNKFFLSMTTDSVNSNDAPGSLQTKYPLGDFRSDENIDIAFDINWSHTYTGWVKVYVNGSLVLTVNGPNKYKPWNLSKPSYAHLRLGNYVIGWSETKTYSVTRKRILYDGIKIGLDGGGNTINDFIPNDAVPQVPTTGGAYVPWRTK